MNTNYTIFDFVVASYTDNKGVALGEISTTTANTVFATSNNTILVATATNAGDVKISEYKLPSGERVLDSIALIDNLATAIEYNNYYQLVHRIDVLEERNNTNVDMSDVDLINLLRANLDYLYPNKPEKPDSIAALITMTMLSTSIYNIPSDTTKLILSAITNNKRDDFNKVVTDTIRTRECDYIKNTCCDLNKANFDNIRYIATTTTRKWNKRGITRSTAKDKEIIRQVLLSVFETEYKLAINKKQSKRVEFII